MTIPNISSPVTILNNADFLLRRCWRIQDCHSCLDTSDPCSWCAVSSTCISNEAPIGLLAPISKSNVCPISDERWELRAKGLGCKVSTLTFLSVMISVVTTVAVALWIWAIVTILARARWRWRKDRLGFQSITTAAKRTWKRVANWRKNEKLKNASNSQDERERTRLLV